MISELKHSLTLLTGFRYLRVRCFLPFLRLILRQLSIFFGIELVLYFVILYAFLRSLHNLVDTFKQCYTAVDSLELSGTINSSQSSVDGRCSRETRMKGSSQQVSIGLHQATYSHLCTRQFPGDWLFFLYFSEPVFWTNENFLHPP